MIAVENSLDPDQDRQIVGPDQELNCDTLMIFMKDDTPMIFMIEVYEKVDFELN